VLRDGRTVATFDHDQIEQDAIIAAMAHGADGETGTADRETSE
jgi:hypothetical protein